MKKLATLLFFVLVGTVALGQSTLPNGNFESWTYNSTHGYYEPDGGFFKTLNILDTIPTPSGVTCYRCDTAHSGSYSARLYTRDISLLQVLIPGVIGTLRINWLNFNATLGNPYTWATKPTRFQGWYQSYPVNGDSTAAILLLSKWNNATHGRDTIAYNRLVFYTTVDQWTGFDELINYRDQTTMPDTITMLLLSCAGYNAVNMMGCVGQIGSQAMYDDVTLTDITGFQYLPMPEVGVKLSPNPASTYTVFTMEKNVQGTIEIYNTQGQTVRQVAVDGNRVVADLTGLAPAVYYYKLNDGKKYLNSGSFIVK
jgi:hypothetical protein